jgi:hypothetical protein
MVGIVLFVIGAGVWVGVQHLGYHEFIELGRVAQRTIEQKKVIVNNLAIRRATEALSKSRGIDGIMQVLRDAFDANDFDGFELALTHNNESQLNWRKPNGGIESSDGHWTLALELKSASGQNLGTFSLYRKCNGSPLVVDVNLLISGFNVALTKALERSFQKPSTDSVRDVPRIVVNADGPSPELI